MDLGDIGYRTLPPFPLLAIDIKNWEFDSSIITEIGLAWTDSESFADDTDFLVPAHYIHYLISEHRDYCNGNSFWTRWEHFNFGASVELPLAELPEAVVNTVITASQGRPVVLVSHKINGDTAKFQKLSISYPWRCLWQWSLILV